MQTKGFPVFSARHKFFPFHLNLLWGGFSIGIWAGELIWRSRQGSPFSSIVFFKGALLLGGAALVYQLATVRRPSFIFLGLFPLTWLAVSKFQWELCSVTDPDYWVWLILFLTATILILTLGDGLKILILVSPIWAFLIYLYSFSFLLPLSFLTAFQGRFSRRTQWAQWGGLLVGLGLFIGFRGWGLFQFYWIDLFDLLVSKRYISFFILGWLGLIAFARSKGFYRQAIYPFFLIPLGFLFWPRLDIFPFFRLELLKWILVFYAGFGFECFRRDLMDQSWHGRLAWFALGMAFFGGVL